MNRKLIISTFLLLTYSLAFAHDLIPHCHTDISHSINDEQEINHHHHKHHNHNNEPEKHTKELMHQHIAHDNHLDEGLFDFVLCLLSEVEHPIAINHHHFFSINTSSTSLKLLSNTIFTSLLQFGDHSELQKENSTAKYFTRKSSDFLMPEKPHSHTRGPPTLFSLPA